MDPKTDFFREFNVYAPRVLASIRALSTTVADRSFRFELLRKRRPERLQKFSPRVQAGALARLGDELHLAVLEHAQEITALYDRAEDFPIPDEVDDRLRDILEPLFAIASAADAEKGTGLPVDSMVKAGRALSGIRVEDNTDEAPLVAVLAALRDICEQRENLSVVISAGGALSPFRRTDSLGWVVTKDKARGLLRPLGFRSGTHRSERFGSRNRPASETARGYEIRFDTVQDLLSRYSDDVEASEASHSKRAQGFHASLLARLNRFGE